MIRLMPHDNALLQSLYEQYRIPTDQYKVRTSDLQHFTSQWNDLAERADDAGDLLRYMINERKCGRWPRLGANHLPMAGVPKSLLTEAEWEILKECYLAIHVATDNYAFSPSLRRDIEVRFAATAKRFLPGIVLAAAMESRRKRGEWPRIGPEEPFADIAAIG